MHVFESTGSYSVKLTLTDGLGFESSDTIFVSIEENNKPDKPNRPSGKIEGKSGSKYTYYSSCSDSENDLLYYKWDWGDGSFSDWQGPYNSGEQVSAAHTWTGRGQYSVRVRAVDDPNHDGDFSDGKMSSWSDSLSVSMPKVKCTNRWENNIFYYKIFDRMKKSGFIFSNIFSKMSQ